VTAAAQDDEVRFPIGSRLAPPNNVMDLELVSSATVLALPSIPLQDLATQVAITAGIEPKRTRFCTVHAVTLNDAGFAVVAGAGNIRRSARIQRISA
jgi:hypothetical protein